MDLRRTYLSLLFSSAILESPGKIHKLHYILYCIILYKTIEGITKKRHFCFDINN